VAFSGSFGFRHQSCLSISYHGGTHTCFLYSSFNLNKTGKSEEGWCSYSRGNIYVCLIMFNAIHHVIDVTLLMGIRIRVMVVNSNFNTDFPVLFKLKLEYRKQVCVPPWYEIERHDLLSLHCLKQSNTLVHSVL
jgi:hypothetical protein